MSVEEVYPGIFRIPVGLPHNPLKELNSYFIPGRDRNLLIDTGFRMEKCRADIEPGFPKHITMKSVIRQSPVSPEAA